MRAKTCSADYMCSMCLLPVWSANIFEILIICVHLTVASVTCSWPWSRGSTNLAFTFLHASWQMSKFRQTQAHTHIHTDTSVTLSWTILGLGHGWGQCHIASCHLSVAPKAFRRLLFALLLFVLFFHFRAFNRRQSQILWGFLFMGNRKAKVKFFVDYFFVISGDGCGGFCPNCRDAAEVCCHCSCSWEVCRSRRMRSREVGVMLCVCVWEVHRRRQWQSSLIFEKWNSPNRIWTWGLGMWMWIYVGRHACAAATRRLFFSIFAVFNSSINIQLKYTKNTRNESVQCSAEKQKRNTFTHFGSTSEWINQHCAAVLSSGASSRHLAMKAKPNQSTGKQAAALSISAAQFLSCSASAVSSDSWNVGWFLGQAAIEPGHLNALSGGGGGNGDGGNKPTWPHWVKQRRRRWVGEGGARRLIFLSWWFSAATLSWSAAAGHITRTVQCKNELSTVIYMFFQLFPCTAAKFCSGLSLSLCLPAQSQSRAATSARLAL